MKIEMRYSIINYILLEYIIIFIRLRKMAD